MAACAALLATAGCTTVGPDFAAPQPPTTESYAMAGDPAASRVTIGPRQGATGAWWTNLGSDQLNAVMAQAIAQNPSLAEAGATLERVQQEAVSIDGARGVQANYTGAASHQRINSTGFGFSFPARTINLFSIGAIVTYDLDLFGGRRRASEAAQATEVRTRYLGDAAYLTLTGNVALQAARIAALRAQIATIEAVIADDQRMIDMIDQAERIGGQASSASSGGQTQLAQDMALLPPIHRQLSAARHQMALLVGRAPSDWTAPDFDLANFTLPATIPVDLPSALVRQRPDILAAEAELHANTARIGVATAAQYPNIRLTSNLTQQALDPTDLFGYSASGWNVGAGLAGPILNGGTLRANRRAAEAEARASMARYQGVVLRAFVQVADVISDLSHDEEALVAYRRAETAAQGNLADARTAWRLGGGTLLAVIDAQRQVSRARRNLALAQGQRLEDIIQLYTATAADWHP